MMITRKKSYRKPVSNIVSMSLMQLLTGSIMVDYDSDGETDEALSRHMGIPLEDDDDEDF